MRRRIGALAVIVAAGCTAAPARKDPPIASVQTSWEATAAPPASRGPADGAWWRTFGDPALDRLMALAQERNLDLRLAEARVREARAQRRGAARELLPEITGSAQVSHGRPSAAQPVAATGARAALGASWETDLFGRLRNEARAADAEAQAVEADRDALRLTLLAEVAGSYFDHRLFRAQHELSAKTVEAQATTVRISRARFEQGLASRLDVERTVAALAVTRARQAQVAEQAEAARHRLVLLLATTPQELGGLLPPAGALPTSDAAAVLGTPTEVVARRPDVKAAERRLVAAAARHDATRALRYPRITLAGLLGVEGGGDVDDIVDAGTGIWSVGANLLAPLINFGRIRAAIDAADARQEQAYLTYERTVRTALQEAQVALVFYAQGAVRARELAAAVESGRKAAELARRQYAEGTLSLLEVLDAERSLYDAELGSAQATAEVAQRVVRLYQTMGIVPAPLPAK